MIIARLQSLLNEEHDLGLVVDGLIGPSTVSAIASLSLSDLLSLQVLFEIETGECMFSAISSDPGFRSPGIIHMRVVDVMRSVENICKALDRTELVASIIDIVDKEAVKLVVEGERCYSVLSRNGSSRGLTQFQPAAWIDAGEQVKRLVDFNIGRYEDFVYFPSRNLMACVGYVDRNIIAMRRLGVPVSRETIYLAHNQGMGFFRTRQPINLSGQSADVQRMILNYLG